MTCFRCSMELRHLRYFVAVADTLNFHRAAPERVHIEQSPLSQQIRNLEQELGIQLSLHTNQTPGSPYHAGTVFLNDALAILARAEESVDRAHRASRGFVGDLTIAYLTSMTGDFLTATVRDFQLKYPEVALSFSDLIPAAIISAVARGAADVGFLRGVFPAGELAVVELGSEPLVVALPKGHRLACKQKLLAADLAKEPFVMLPDEGSMGYNDLIRAYCHASGFTPNVHAEGNQMQAVIWLVYLGVGISLIPTSLQGLLRENIVYRPLDGPPKISAKLVYRPNDTSPIVKNFRELVCRAAQDRWPT